jgi:SLT domain-containing protein
MIYSLAALFFLLYGGHGFLSLPPLPAEKPPPLLYAAAPPLAPENLGQRRVELTQLLEFTSPPEAVPVPPSIPCLSDPRLKAQINFLVKKYAKRQGVDEKLARAVLQKESGGNPAAVSPKGAMGLMQLMPETAQSMGVRDPFNPEENVAAGIKFLKACLNRFSQNVPLALAAYNAGPETVKKYGGVPPYPETQQYVAGILGCPVDSLTKKNPAATDGKNAALPALAKNSRGAKVKSTTAVNLPDPTWKLVQADVTVARVKWKIPPSLTALNPITTKSDDTGTAAKYIKDTSLKFKNTKEASGSINPGIAKFFPTYGYR